MIWDRGCSTLGSILAGNFEEFVKGAAIARKHSLTTRITAPFYPPHLPHPPYLANLGRVSKLVP
jgi:hypothetical protein